MIDVLLVEDDPGDVLLTQEAFAESKVGSRLSVVHDGAAAMAFLRREDTYDGAPRPHLILLDLNLPGLHGHEILAQIKADAGLRRIPVVVLTASDADHDVNRSYQLHASAYITKPMDFDRYLHAVRQIDDFFISVATLPDRPT
jgi:two-component system response regulator